MGLVSTDPRLSRGAIAGYCVDIDGASWHQDGTACEHCGYGIDEDPDRPGSGRGFFGEPLVKREP
jgi:hypothetical protein